MITEGYSIQDVKAGVFHAPQYYVNEATAIRSIKMAMSQGAGAMSEFPEDFRLWKVGKYDDSRGIMLPQTNPTLIGELKDLVKDNKNVTQ